MLLQHCRLAAAAAAANSSGDGSAGDLPRIWGETATLRQIQFHQTSPSSVYDMAPRLAASMVQHGTLKSISVGSMLDESADTFPAAAVQDFASRLVLENAWIERCSLAAWEEMERLHELNDTKVERKTEPYYGVDYFVSQLDPADVAAWTDETGKSSF